MAVAYALAGDIFGRVDSWRSSRLLDKHDAVPRARAQCTALNYDRGLMRVRVARALWQAGFLVQC